MTQRIKKAATKGVRKMKAMKKLHAVTPPRKWVTQAQPISPRTKLPIEHPESQAVERAHYEMQTSLNSRPVTKAELAALLEPPKE